MLCKLYIIFCVCVLYVKYSIRSVVEKVKPSALLVETSPSAQGTQGSGGLKLTWLIQVFVW